LVSRADVVVITYDNDLQVSSGVSTDAFAAGRPVVATDCSYTRGPLADGAGLVVAHSDEATAAV
jgi:hypothetical protein